MNIDEYGVYRCQVRKRNCKFTREKCKRRLELTRSIIAQMTESVKKQFCNFVGIALWKIMGDSQQGGLDDAMNNDA